MTTISGVNIVRPGIALARGMNPSALGRTNVEGPPGPQGIQGVQGIQGIQGLTGPSGGVGPITDQATAQNGFDNASLITPLSLTQALSHTFGLKNIMGRNGGMEVFQRQYIQNPFGLNASSWNYTIDGWYVVTNTNQIIDISQAAGLSSRSKYCGQFQRRAGQTGTGILYLGYPLDVDESVIAAGQVLALTFHVAGGANWSPTNGTLNWVLYTGNGGSVARRVLGAFTNEVSWGGSVNIVPGAAATKVTFVMPAAVMTNVTQMELLFTWYPTGTAGASDYFQIDNVDLRVLPSTSWANVQNEFDPVPEYNPFVVDLIRCWRFLQMHYYARLYVAVAAGYTDSLALPFFVPMRASPTYSTTGVSTGNAGSIAYGNQGGGFYFSMAGIAGPANTSWQGYIWMSAEP